MTAILNPADLQFLLNNVLLGDTPVPGADPLAPDGIRTIDGTNNNISGLTLFDQFGELVDTATFGNVNHAFTHISTSVGPNSYGVNPMVVDDSPRKISNIVADQTASNPAVATAQLLTQGEPLLNRLPENSLFTFFGQFFDHGLDFVSKQGSGVIMIPILPNDPLYDPSPGAFNMMPVTRVETDANGDAINTTAPFIEQSQTYGSTSATTFYLKEYDINGVATGDLVHGVNGLGTWADIKANANKWARAQPGASPLTEMLKDSDIGNIPDPAMWDPLANGGLGDFLPGAGTGQAFLADIAHNANPAGGLTPDADTIINPNGFGAPPPAPGEYDNELLDAHLISGDPRANENVVLTSLHTVFHAEHTRILNQIKDWVQQQDQIEPGFAAQWTGDMYFDAAKVANEMQYQHLAVEEFARRMSPNIDAFAAYQVEINPNITTEFSQAVYRLGHSMLTDNVKGIDTSGQVTDMSLINAFLDPVTFSQFGASDFLKGGQFEQGARIDEFVVDSLRNFLVGLPLDLAAINIARGRDVGMPTLNQLRADLFAQTGEATLAPYTSWADFGTHLLNPASLVNFIAAYSNEVSIQTARDSGLPTANDDARAAAAIMMANPTFMGPVAGGGDNGFELIDLWLGGLAEAKVPFGLLGSTFDFVFAQQMLALQNGDRFYYLGRLNGNLLDQIEGQTFADLMMRGTGVTHLNGDVFGTPDSLTELGTLALTDLIKTPAEIAAVVHEVIGGTNADNTIFGGAGNDSIFGDGGNDTLEGGAGDDHIYGGDGNDTIQGELGFDFLRGDDGNDEIHGGADDDKVIGGAGDDMLFGDQGFDEILGNAGNDTMHGGNQDDKMLGGEGDDVLFGDDGNDSLDGELGNDVLFGGRGDDILIGGLGDDMLIGGSGADAMDGGIGGWDIASYETWLDTLPPGTGTGLIINMFDSALSTGDARGDTYLGIQAVRGTNFNDTMTGDELDNVLIGGLGNDALSGGLGNDTLIGMEGNDSFVGGPGIDTVLVRGLEADFSTFLEISGIELRDLETVVSTDEGIDFLTFDVEWIQFDDALLNTTTFQYAPLVNLSNTVERTQNGTTVIGELEGTVVVNDGASLIGNGIEVADILIDDPDGPNGGPQVLTLLGDDAASFTIRNIGGINKLFLTGGGANSFTNYEVKPFYHVTVDVADAIGGSSVNYTLNITDVNDNAPVFISGDRVNVQEGVSTNTIVYRADTTDLDTTGETIVYTLGGADAANFTLVNGELRFVSSPTTASPTDVGMDNVYDITIDATDGVNAAVQKSVSVNVVGPPSNIINGTPGADNPLNGTATNDIINGLGGNDTIFGLAGADILNGDAGGDNLFGGSGNDHLFGGDSTDTLFGDAGFDTMDGGENSDVFFVDGNDTVTDTGTIGYDKAQINDPAGVSQSLAGWSGVERVNGFTGNDTIDASSQTVGIVLSGGDGDDVLTGGSGDDVLLGGAGNDTLSGGAGNDSILGGTGNDMMDGGSGNDVFFIGESLDVITDGGTGFDKAVINNAAGVTINIGTWTSVERINGYTGNDTIDATGMTVGITMASQGGIDTLTGGSGNDVFYAGAGADIVNGAAGNDALIGSDGNDSLNGGADNDFLLGGNGADNFVFDAVFGQDYVKDFTDLTDMLDFSGHAGVNVFTDVVVTQVGANTEIALTAGGTDLITLENVLATDITAADFIFV